MPHYSEIDCAPLWVVTLILHFLLKRIQFWRGRWEQQGKLSIQRCASRWLRFVNVSGNSMTKSVQSPLGHWRALIEAPHCLFLHINISLRFRLTTHHQLSVLARGHHWNDAFFLVRKLVELAALSHYSNFYLNHKIQILEFLWLNSHRKLKGCTKSIQLRLLCSQFKALWDRVWWSLCKFTARWTMRTARSPTWTMVTMVTVMIDSLFLIFEQTQWSN